MPNEHEEIKIPDCIKTQQYQTAISISNLSAQLANHYGQLNKMSEALKQAEKATRYLQICIGMLTDEYEKRFGPPPTNNANQKLIHPIGKMKR